MSGAVETVTIGDCRLILGDCREILPTLGNGGVDLLADPPYGIRATAGQIARANKRHGKALAPMFGDVAPKRQQLGLCLTGAEK